MNANSRGNPQYKSTYKDRGETSVHLRLPDWWTTSVSHWSTMKPKQLRNPKKNLEFLGLSCRPARLVETAKIV
eukprot:g83366.t1